MAGAVLTTADEVMSARRVSPGPEMNAGGSIPSWEPSPQLSYGSPSSYNPPSTPPYSSDNPQQRSEKKDDPFSDFF